MKESSAWNEPIDNQSNEITEEQKLDKTQLTVIDSSYKTLKSNFKSFLKYIRKKIKK